MIETLLEKARDIVLPGYVPRSNQRRERNRIYKKAYDRIDHKIPYLLLRLEIIHALRENMERERSDYSTEAYVRASGEWNRLYRRMERRIDRIQGKIDKTPIFSIERIKLNKMKRRIEEKIRLMNLAIAMWHEYTLRDRNKETAYRRLLIATIGVAGALYYLHINPNFLRNIVGNLVDAYDEVRQRFRSPSLAPSPAFSGT